MGIMQSCRCLKRHINVTLSVKSSLILGGNKAAFHSEGHNYDDLQYLVRHQSAAVKWSKNKDVQTNNLDRGITGGGGGRKSQIACCN